jgi:hypothetical protein
VFIFLVLNFAVCTALDISYYRKSLEVLRRIFGPERNKRTEKIKNKNINKMILLYVILLVKLYCRREYDGQNMQYKRSR